MSTFVRSLALLALIGCSSAPADPPGEIARSSLTRDTAPSVDDADLTALRAGATGFALDMHRALAAGGGNTILSPHSIQVAFGMLRPGARGATADEIDVAMGWSLPPDRLYPAMNHLDLELAARNRAGVRVAIANQIWVQAGFEVEHDYLDTIAVNYGAGVALWDFVSDAEGGRLAIDSWVSDRTDGNIPELIPTGVLDDLTRLVLVNAVHFDAAWDVAFDASATRDASFERADGSSVNVPIMAVALEDARFADTETYKAVELPYAGQDLSMVAILPVGGTLTDLEAGLDVAALDSIVASLATTEVVDVAMPRFAFGSDLDLEAPLRARGMNLAFGDADLTGINTQEDLYVAAALHSAAIQVSESGTEASAATAIVVGTRSSVTRPRIDLTRPFLFVIRDRPTGAILFVGRVADPSAA